MTIALAIPSLTVKNRGGGGGGGGALIRDCALNRANKVKREDGLIRNMTVNHLGIKLQSDITNRPQLFLKRPI